MKTMKCSELGGACDLEFQANSWDEMVQLSRQHGKEMMEQNDQAHLQAMGKMRDLMQDPGAMDAWFQARKSEFEALTDNS